MSSSTLGRKGWWCKVLSHSPGLPETDLRVADNPSGLNKVEGPSKDPRGMWKHSPVRQGNRARVVTILEKWTGKWTCTLTGNMDFKAQASKWGLACGLRESWRDPKCSRESVLTEKCCPHRLEGKDLCQNTSPDRVRPLIHLMVPLQLCGLSIMRKKKSPCSP